MDSSLSKCLQYVDPAIYRLCELEKKRQIHGLEMIASENFASRAVLECLSSSFHNKYSEGQIGARYYGGNEIVDEMETLCKARCLEAYHLDPNEWGVNVQPLSGSPANFAVYTALVEPHGRIMGLDLPDGGHLTHGFMTAARKVSATSLFFESMPYKVDPVSGLIDYDQLALTSSLFRPRIIIAGVSCYSRNLDYKRFKEIAKGCGAYLMADMAHISGLVAAGEVPSPFDYSDVVTSTTHKSLRGPRSGIIFYRKGVRSVNAKGDKVMFDLEKKINDAVFPALQGGPHNMAIAGVAVTMKLASQPEFKVYQQQVKANCRKFCEEMIKYGYKVVTGGSDNHLCLIDFRPQNLDGSKMEKILEDVSIATNKNTCPGDKSAFRPSGIRFGTCALTSRGLNEEHMIKVAEYVHKSAVLAAQIQKEMSGTTFKDFKDWIIKDEGAKNKISSLKEDVEGYASKFEMPGIDQY